ncbi:helix-turn-helix transcriptional regulator [Actinokineospora diospyrosa]
MMSTRSPRGTGDRTTAGRRCAACGAALAIDNTAQLCNKCFRDQRDQLSKPARPGRDFFETDDFRSAFETQHIGKVLKAYRHHPRHLQIFGKALNQELLGRWLGLTQAQVSKLENGKPEQNLDILRAYAQVLHLPQHLLWFDLPGQSRQQRPSVTEDMDVDRRDFMRVASGAFLGMTDPFHRTLSPRAGTTDLDYLANRTARLRRLDNHLGGRDTYNLYLSEMSSTIGYVKHAHSNPQLERELIKIIAEQAQLTGWAAFDAGMHAEARKHYQASLSAAREANDPALTGNALAFLAYQEVGTTGPNVALAEASFAAAEVDATPRVRALLLERKAWTYAVAGNYQATSRALEGARVALRAQDDRPEPDWVFWVDENEIEIMSGRCWTALGRPNDAVAALEAALANFDETHARDKSLYLTYLANALIDSSEVEQAAHVTARSMDLARGVGSVRPLALISEVMHRLREHRGLDPVSALFE